MYEGGGKSQNLQPETCPGVCFTAQIQPRSISTLHFHLADQCVSHCMGKWCDRIFNTVGFRVEGLGLRVEGSGFRVHGLWFRV